MQRTSSSYLAPSIGAGDRSRQIAPRLVTRLFSVHAARVLASLLERLTHAHATARGAACECGPRTRPVHVFAPLAGVYTLILILAPVRVLIRRPRARAAEYEGAQQGEDECQNLLKRKREDDPTSQPPVPPAPRA
jgi:hypothetical protein